MKKRFLTLIGILLLLSGCRSIPQLENGEQIIVELNGRNITANEFYEKLKTQYGTDSLINMIDEWIVNQEYATNDEMNKYVDEKFAQDKKDYEAYYNTDFKTILNANGFSSEDDYKKYLLLGYKQNELIEDYVGSTITDKEINEYYEKNVYGKITARHIIIIPDTTEDMTEDQKTKAKKDAYNKAVELIKQLKNGADFATLAKDNSEDAAAADGGLLDPFDNTTVVKEFFDAAYALKDGKYTEKPVESQFGYHIILRESAEEKPTLETSKQNIIDTLVTQKLSADAENNNSLSYKALVNAREKYKMNITDTDIADEYNKSIANYK